MLTISISELIAVQQKASLKLDIIVRDILALEKALKQLTDQDLEQLFIDGGSSDPIASREAFRTWQSTMRGFADNYTGDGQLSDKSLEIQKAIKPSFDI